VPMVVRWPDGLDGGQHFHEMVHFVDWFPTLLAMAGVPCPADLSLDGQDILPVLRGDAGKVQTRRFWQWNRFTPLVITNAAMRDGPWKLVRPRMKEAMRVPPEIVAMDRVLKYQPGEIIEVFRGPEPARDVPAPPPAQLFHIDEDPLEQYDLAAAEPGRAKKMLRELETWFESVEADRRSIDDVW